MDPRVVTTLKMAAWAFILLFLFVFGSKHYKKFARKEALVNEMRTTVTDASLYRALSPKDAQATLLKGVALIDEAKSLGLEPAAFFNKVFERESDQAGKITDEFSESPVREKLARETLIRAYQHAGQFSLLGSPEHRAKLAKGELPDVSPKPVIACIIDPAISPGMEKIVPNLELRPATTSTAAPTDLEVAAAKTLASDLASASVIEYEAEKRIKDHYVKGPAPKKE